MSGTDSALSGNDDNGTRRKKSSRKSEVSNEDIMNKLISIQTAADDTNQKLQSYTNRTNEKISAIENQAVSTTERVDTLSQQVDSLLVSNQLLHENQEKAKQRQLLNNITIMGIAPFCEESLFQLVVDIGNVLNVKIQSEDIEKLYRINGSKNHIIVVRFFDWNLKSAIMRNKRDVVIHECDVFSDVTKDSDQNNQIFINHHLTPYFGNLLQYGRNEVKKETLHSCWINSNGLLVKLNEHDTPHLFSSIDALQSFINSGPSNTTQAEKFSNRGSSIKPKSNAININAPVKINNFAKPSRGRGGSRGARNGGRGGYQANYRKGPNNNKTNANPNTKRKKSDNSPNSSIDSTSREAKQHKNK